MEIHNPGLEMALFLTDTEYRELKLEQSGLDFDEYRRLLALALSELPEDQLADALVLIQEFIKNKK